MKIKKRLSCFFLKTSQFWGSWSRPPIPQIAKERRADWLTKPEQQLSVFKLFRKTALRWFYVQITGQSSQHLDRIPRSTRKILWLHISNNIGDSLMRLAPIQLLQNFQVDLYATGTATQLFQNGMNFNKVYRIGVDETLVKAEHYDLVIIDALQTKPLKQKIKVARKIPFVTIHEYFHFCRDDYNLIYFTWWRVEYLLRDFEFTPSEPKLILNITTTIVEKIHELNIPSNTIAIAVGGVEAYRSYPHWGDVVENLLKINPEQNIILLGSNNGAELANKISEKYSVNNVKNYVAQYSLIETAAIIKNCKVLCCADGGLLHIANAVGCETLSLFAQEKPEWRYVADDNYTALYAEHAVSDIPAKEICMMLTQ